MAVLAMFFSAVLSLLWMISVWKWNKKKPDAALTERLIGLFVCLLVFLLFCCGYVFVFDLSSLALP